MYEVLKLTNDYVINNLNIKEIRAGILPNNDRSIRLIKRLNFKYVGENFTYEARSIHYGKNRSKKGIYGNASSKDIKELKDEGIETSLIPLIDDKEN